MNPYRTVLAIFLALCLLGALAVADDGDPSQEAEPKTRPPVPEGLTVSDPVTVDGGMDETTIENLYIETDGDGITVEDMSEVTISGCYIVAGGAGIRVRDEGEVTLRNCFVLGKEGALAIDDNGEVHATDCIIQGTIKKDDNGEFFDEGFNAFQ